MVFEKYENKTKSHYCFPTNECIKAVWLRNFNAEPVFDIYEF